MVSALARRDSLAPAGGVSFSCGHFLLAERRISSSQIAILACISSDFFFFAGKLQQRTSESVDHRATHDRYCVRASKLMDDFRDLPWTDSIPQDLSAIR